MGRRGNIPIIGSAGGFSLIELVLVMTLLGLCAVAGAVSLVYGLGAQEARGAAQSWQAAAAQAQVGVLWSAERATVERGPGRVRVSWEGGAAPGDVEGPGAAVSVETNLARWRIPGGVSVRFTGTFAAPDGGGSLFFQASGRGYRVAVRPESGLTSRSVAEPAQ